MAFAIMCSGGDAPGMNPAIKKFVDYAFKKNKKTYFIYDGLEGLIDNHIKKANHKDVAGIMHTGGTIIRSSRSKRFFKYKHRKKAYKNLKSHNITGLVVLGGDGSFRAMDVFCDEFDINFIGIPATIDNDIYKTEYCLGVDTALNVIRDALDKIRDTASSLSRAFLVEVMGRNSGYLSVVSAITSGAEICVIPEKKLPKKTLKRKLNKEIKNGRRYILAIVCEGCKNTKKIQKWIQNTFGLDTKISILGHIQRGGNPSVYDRMMAFEFVIKSIDYLLKHNNSNKIITYNKGVFDFADTKDIATNKHQLPKYLLDAIKYLD